MKHLKTYEDNNRKDLKDLKKLLYHIKNIIDDFGYTTIIYFTDYKYSLHVTKNEKTTSKIMDIEGEFSSSLTFLSITIRIGMNDFSLFIQNYFKTIKGLELYSENSRFYNCQYKITGDIDHIINQISKNDIEMKMNTNKYNI